MGCSVYTAHAWRALIGVKTLPNKGGDETCQRTGGVIARRKATLGLILNKDTHTHTKENARGAGLAAPFIFNNLIDSVKGCQWRHL